MILTNFMSRRGPKKKAKLSGDAAAAPSSPAAGAGSSAAGTAAGGPNSASGTQGAAGVEKTRTIRVNRANLVYPAGRSVVCFCLTRNTPCLAYDSALVADKGFEPRLWTSARMVEFVLYLETAVPLARYELVLVEGVYALSRVKEAAAHDERVPVADDNKDVLARTPDWSQVLWGPDFVAVGDAVKIVGLKTLRWEKFSNANYVEV